MRTIPEGMTMESVKSNFGFKFSDKTELVGQPVVSATPYAKITRLEMKSGTIAVDHGSLKAAGLPEEIEANQYVVSSVNPLNFQLKTVAPPKPKGRK